MINETHLAIVRAALTFWDEEMSSTSFSLYKHYLHSSDSDRRITPEDVTETRLFFNRVKIANGALDQRTGEIKLKSPIVRSAHDIGEAQENVVVLVNKQARD